MDIVGVLSVAVDKQASDIFLVAGMPLSYKAGGRIEYQEGDKLSPAQIEELIKNLYEVAGNRDMKKIQEDGDDDFSFALPKLSRFRANVFRQRGSLAAVVRIVSFEIPDWRACGIPEQVMALSDMLHGMVLVTGTAGSGKSTTQACVIDQINRNRECHIITLEDPIEYLHRDVRSIVSQREIAIDT